MNARYAIYFIPEPGTALARLGSALLGRDTETGHAVAQPSFPGFSQERLHALTANARRYGLHATLKAPFFLNQGMTERNLLLFAARFAGCRQAIILPRLELARIGSFFALVPSGKSPKEQEAIRDINALAADAVSFFDPFRAAPSEQEIARRNPQKLSTRQRELLVVWGYPYVFEEYRFHITLTGKLNENVESDEMGKRLSSYLAAACNEPVAISGICICKQMTHVDLLMSDLHSGNTAADFMPLKKFCFHHGKTRRTTGFKSWQHACS
ncbi:MAG: DUF1045 domain-containing protein [Betaproteobacteria bacterium]|nr:DUF1045 domain-containing protein [Betaproteobacteria bacterium]